MPPVPVVVNTHPSLRGPSTARAASLNGLTSSTPTLFLDAGRVHRLPSISSHLSKLASVLRQAVSRMNLTILPKGPSQASHTLRNSASLKVRSRLVPRPLPMPLIIGDL